MYPKLTDEVIEKFKSGEITLSIHKRYEKQYAEWLKNVGIEHYWFEKQWKIDMWNKKYYRYTHIKAKMPKLKMLNRKDASLVRKQNKEFEKQELIKQKQEIENKLKEL